MTRKATPPWANSTPSSPADREAVEAARRIEQERYIGSQFASDARKVARALLSLSLRADAREEWMEECIAIAGAVCEEMSDCSPWHIATVIEGRIRSLSSAKRE